MSTDFNFSVNLPLVVRGAVSAKRIRFPPFNPCVRLSGSKLSARTKRHRRDWPRFSKPPYDPGRSDFPSPVLTWALHTIYQRTGLPNGAEA